MNTKTILVVLYLLYLIVVTLRINHMKKLDTEAYNSPRSCCFTWFISIIKLAFKCCCLFPFLSKRNKREGFNAGLEHKMPYLDGMPDKLSVEENKPKSIPVDDNNVKETPKDSAPVDYSMSNDVDSSNTDPSVQSGMTGTRLDYRVSSYDGVSVKAVTSLMKKK